MKTLYLDCGMGAAGDMLAAALLELLPDPGAFVAELNALGFPGVHIRTEPAVKCGITGTHFAVTVHGQEEGHGQHHHHHHHEHEHKHAHEHHHSGLHEIEHIVRGHLALPERVKRDVLAVYRQLAEAESHAHGIPVSDIHFHEVGTMDAIADITAVCLLMDRLAPGEVIASPVHTGSGQVRCAHGILPVPAPATAYLLRDVPIYGGTVQGELCTPTGAALLKHFVTRFGDMPVMRVSAIGYGCGKKDFEAANCVRALLGETENAAGSVLNLSCNLDDMTAEAVSFAMERLFDAGALEVYTLSAGMKKSRSGLLLRVICRPQDRETIVQTIFRHTSTIGIRESVNRRYVLEREIQTVDTAYGPVRKKISQGFGVTRTKYEYEDLARIAREQNLSLKEAEALVSE
ncbi:MAG: nickel pincer cofactor biosynthesis protein LarC [Oscillospiraceae bacterium]|nr:nickel pincer cofactor biosynthesis protein LarC [Oscillospiraceae bacterium]